jgi:hypothetical protein
MRIERPWRIVCQRHHLSSCRGRSRKLFSGAVAGAESAQAAVHPSAVNMSINPEITCLVTMLHEVSAPDPHLILQTSGGQPFWGIVNFMGRSAESAGNVGR